MKLVKYIVHNNETMTLYIEHDNSIFEIELNQDETVTLGDAIYEVYFGNIEEVEEVLS